MKILRIIENRRKFYTFSMVIILAGFLAMFTYKFMNHQTALNYDIDFVGGTVMNVNIEKEFNKEDIMKIVYEATNSESIQVQKVQGENSVIIKYQVKDTVPQENKVQAAPLTAEQNTVNQQPVQTEPTTTDVTTPDTEVPEAPNYQNHIENVIKALSDKYGLKSENFISTEDISPTISTEMQLNAILSILLGTLFILIYISIRFKNVKMGIAAILALLHDVLVVLAVYAIFRIPINNAFIAAVLTIVGYSINDTVIIFDRIRENKKLYTKLSLTELINKSITETFARSIYTSMTTVIVTTVLFIFGVDKLREFTFPLIVGIISGTYSSIGNASPLWYDMIKNQEKKA
ncbi:MAG TPA: protein translocase subunit SecF [Clostridiales bacterium]|nr:protein translocase subunit SecF [Clostridiales bacterium]